MDNLLNLGQTNPYDISLDTMSARLLCAVSKDQKNNPSRCKNNSKNDQADGPADKDGCKVGLYLANNP